jgi:hypothetical protein
MMMHRSAILPFLGESLISFLRILSLRASVLSSSPPLHPAFASRRHACTDDVLGRH